MRLAFVGLIDFVGRFGRCGRSFISARIMMNEMINTDWNPAELAKSHHAEKNRWLALCHTNEEICQTLWKLEADHAREIYVCCRRESGNLDFFLANDKAMYRLLSAVLGAFSGRCALCGWVATQRGEIRKALKSASGVVFQIPELEGWVQAIEEKVRGCPERHSGLEIWRLISMLRVKVAEPKSARIETEYYD
jgi:hypothetical protein